MGLVISRFGYASHVRGWVRTPSRGQQRTNHVQRDRARCHAIFFKAKHASRVDISAGQCSETHISPCNGLVPKEINLSYGVAVSKNSPESHRTYLGGTGPRIGRKTWNQNDLFQMLKEEWEKIPTSFPAQTDGLHAPRMSGHSPSKWFFQ
jgi:hypothetical protein